MNSQVSKKQPIRGGGALLLTPNKVQIRAKNFLKKTHTGKKTDMELALVNCLVVDFDFSVEQVASTLGVSKSTAYRRVSDAQWHAKRRKSIMELSDKARDYIIYNAKFMSCV